MKNDLLYDMPFRNKIFYGIRCKEYTSTASEGLNKFKGWLLWKNYWYRLTGAVSINFK